MEQQAMDNTELGITSVSPETQWGPDAPKSARAVFGRYIKEGANVPLFVGQTMINALRDLGYNNTTSAICEHVDNSFQWGAQDVRLYFHEKGKKGSRKIDVLVMDNGEGMSPNVLRAVTAFGGSMCYDNRETVGKYGMGMKAAALSMGPVLEIYSWQESGAIYRMILDTVDLSNKNTNVVQLPEPVLVDTLPPEVREIFVQPMAFPKNAAEQEILAESDEILAERLGASGTIIYIPDCDRLTHRTAKTLVDHATKEMARIYRRFLKDGRNLFINNRRVRPFDPTYRMEEATHASIAELGEKQSRQVESWKIAIPVEEDSPVTREITVRLFILPIETWDQLSRKVLKNDLAHGNRRGQPGFWEGARQPRSEHLRLQRRDFACRADPSRRRSRVRDARSTRRPAGQESMASPAVAIRRGCAAVFCEQELDRPRARAGTAQ
jgi:hypothetical protein